MPFRAALSLPSFLARDSRKFARLSPTRRAVSSGQLADATNKTVSCLRRGRTGGEAIPFVPSSTSSIHFSLRHPRGPAEAARHVPRSVPCRIAKFKSRGGSRNSSRTDSRSAYAHLERRRSPLAGKEMSEAIVARLKKHGFAHRVEHLHYPDAGHMLRYPYLPTTARDSRNPHLRNARYSFGGTAPADAEAQADSWRHAIAFLKSSLT